MALLPLSRLRSQTLTSSVTDCLLLSYFFPCIVVKLEESCALPEDVVSS